MAASPSGRFTPGQRTVYPCSHCGLAGSRACLYLVGKIKNLMLLEIESHSQSQINYMKQRLAEKLIIAQLVKIPCFMWNLKRHCRVHKSFCHWSLPRAMWIITPIHVNKYLDLKASLKSVQLYMQLGNGRTGSVYCSSAAMTQRCVTHILIRLLVKGGNY
jgi:hypothetical protein